VTIHEVDIDNFDQVDDGAHRNRSHGFGHHDRPTQADESAASDRPYEPYKALLVIVSILVGFVATGFLVYAPTLAQHEELLDPTVDNPCVKVYQEALFSLQRLKGMAWVEFVLACAVNGVLLNNVLVGMENRYCTKPGATPPNVSPDGIGFYANLSSFCIENLWILVTTSIVIWISIEDLANPDRRLKVACHLDFNDYIDDNNSKDNKTFNNILNNNTISDLNGYYVACHVRLTILTFLVVSRGKILFARKSCEHVRVVWKRIWMTLLWVLEVILLVLSGTTLFVALLPTLDDMANFDPYLVRKQ
jgi:hypothetical protein